MPNLPSPLRNVLSCNQALAEKIDWKSEKSFAIGAVTFDIDTTQNRAREITGDLSLSKQLPYLDSYFRYVDLTAIRNVVEVGFFRGGGAGFFFELLAPEKLVTLELRPHKEPSFEAYRAADPVRVERLKNFHGVDQSDKQRLRAILDEEFTSPIDLVVDDASHLYAPTRASFEVIFPRVAPGGYYIVEDWGWAHRPGTFQQSDGLWADKPALSNFIFELLMLQATNPFWFENVVVLPYMLIIRAGVHKPMQEFSIDDSMVSRGKTLTLI